jgi:phage terminase large subunit-like protein
MIVSQQMKTSVPFQYAFDVLEGNIVAGQWIKLAVKRFFDGLKPPKLMATS